MAKLNLTNADLQELLGEVPESKYPREVPTLPGLISDIQLPIIHELQAQTYEVQRIRRALQVLNKCGGNLDKALGELPYGEKGILLLAAKLLDRKGYKGLFGQLLSEVREIPFEAVVPLEAEVLESMLPGTTLRERGFHAYAFYYLEIDEEEPEEDKEWMSELLYYTNPMSPSEKQSSMRNPKFDWHRIEISEWVDRAERVIGGWVVTLVDDRWFFVTSEELMSEDVFRKPIVSMPWTLRVEGMGAFLDNLPRPRKSRDLRTALSVLAQNVVNDPKSVTARTITNHPYSRYHKKGLAGLLREKGLSQSFDRDVWSSLENRLKKASMPVEIDLGSSSEEVVQVSWAKSNVSFLLEMLLIDGGRHYAQLASPNGEKRRIDTDLVCVLEQSESSSSGLLLPLSILAYLASDGGPIYNFCINELDLAKSLQSSIDGLSDKEYPFSGEVIRRRQEKSLLKGVNSKLAEWEIPPLSGVEASQLHEDLNSHTRSLVPAGRKLYASKNLRNPDATLAEVDKSRIRRQASRQPLRGWEDLTSKQVKELRKRITEILKVSSRSARDARNRFVGSGRTPLDPHPDSYFETLRNLCKKLHISYFQGSEFTEGRIVLQANLGGPPLNVCTPNRLLELQSEPEKKSNKVSWGMLMHKLTSSGFQGNMFGRLQNVIDTLLEEGFGVKAVWVQDLGTQIRIFIKDLSGNIVIIPEMSSQYQTVPARKAHIYKPQEQDAVLDMTTLSWNT